MKVWLQSVELQSEEAASVEKVHIQELLLGQVVSGIEVRPVTIDSVLPDHSVLVTSVLSVPLSDGFRELLLAPDDSVPDCELGADSEAEPLLVGD